MTSTQDAYDAMLTTLFDLLEEYQYAMKLAEDHQYACVDLMTDCERQSGLFSTQLNSSSYFNVPLSARRQVQFGATETGQLTSQSNHNNDKVESISIIDRPITTPPAPPPQNTTQPSSNCDLSDDSGDDDSDSRVYTSQQLLKLFAISPSLELLKLQSGWNEYLTHHVPQIYHIKAQLLRCIEDIERFQSLNKLEL